MGEREGARERTSKPSEPTDTEEKKPSGEVRDDAREDAFGMGHERALEDEPAVVVAQRENKGSEAPPGPVNCLEGHWEGGGDGGR